MNVRSRVSVILLCLAAGNIMEAEPDSLSYPELMRSETDEFSAEEGCVSLKVSFEDQLEFHTKAQLTYNGFTFNYRNTGDMENEIVQKTSLEYSWKGLMFGHGSGYLHVAHGLVLGYTMMKFSPAFSGQAGIRPVKIKVGTYDQYKGLTTLRWALGPVGLSLFRYDGGYGGVIESAWGDWRLGLGVYGADRMLIESWTSWRKGSLNASVNMSASIRGINHLSSDLLYKKGSMQFYGSAVWLSPEFDCIKKDSKWGSGLSPGSRGLAGGIRFNRPPWCISAIGQSILGNRYREEGGMLECRFRQQPFEISGIYSHSCKQELDKSDIFPFPLTWQQSIKHNLKLNMRIKISKPDRLICQIQGDPAHPFSYVWVCRLEHKTDLSSLKFQLTRCNGSDNDLYFVRPAGSNYYGIRKAPKNETLYLDLIYSVKLGRFEAYVHVRNEGVNLGFNYQ